MQERDSVIYRALHYGMFPRLRPDQGEWEEMITAVVILAAIAVVLFFAVMGLAYISVMLYLDGKPVEPPPISLWEDADYEQYSGR